MFKKKKTVKKEKKKKLDIAIEEEVPVCELSNDELKARVLSYDEKKLKERQAELEEMIGKDLRKKQVYDNRWIFDSRLGTDFDKFLRDHKHHIKEWQTIKRRVDPQDSEATDYLKNINPV